MGVVYRGERVQLGRPVAVKFLHPWIAAQKTFLSRFENEARAMSRLGHPNCVSVIDFGVESGPYLVMDFVTGKTLRDAVHGQGPQPPARALHIVRQLLAGLAHAHAQGIVHRDLKPDNLILTDEVGLDDHLRILDFGLAKLRDGPAMTAGMAVGTPSYMSPEQSGAAGTVDARSDVYSVGVLLFELLTGRKPFEAQQIGELILMHREVPPPSVRALAPAAGISPELEALVLKALSKRQEDRPQSAAEMAAALDATPEGGVRAEAPAPPPVSPAPAASPAAPAVAAVPRPGALPLPPATGRSPRAPEPTIVETATAIMRRHDLPAAPVAAAAAPPLADQTTADAVAAGASPAAEGAAGGLGEGHRDRARSTPGGGCRRGDRVRGDRDRSRGRASPGDRARGNGGCQPVRRLPPRPLPSRRRPAEPAPRRPARLRLALPVPRPIGSRRPAVCATTANGSRRSRSWRRPGARRPRTPTSTTCWPISTSSTTGRSRGSPSAQSAIRKNPALKGDGDLVNAVIESLASDKTYDRSQAFLRGLGPAATPFLKEAAHRNPSAKVRERAAEVLQGAGAGGGGARSAFGSSQHSSSSLFHR